MRIGKQTQSNTAIATSDAESITVRGYDLCDDLIGKINFTDYFWLLVLGEKPTPAQRDMMAGFKTGHIVNPVARGHIAYRTDDLPAFKAHLEAQGVAYSDWGNAAVAGWHQIFFYDPDGNVIEVHQVD